MTEKEEGIELKFRIYYGTDIAQSSYVRSMTVATLKKRLLSEWPQAKTETPKTVSEVKLIHGGRVYENTENQKEMQKMNSCSCTIL